MNSYTEAAIVFADLKDAYADLEAARDSPKEARRAFSRFIELSQKLTGAMRKDASRIGKGKWVASSFSGWNPVTELIKYLRNEDQHNDQVFLSVHERRHFPVPPNLPPGFQVKPDKTLVFEGTWRLTDQLLDAPPDGISTCEINPTTGQPTGKEMQLLKVERYYILQARSDKAKQKIAAAGSVDIHVLAKSAFSTLTNYFQFFCEYMET